MKVAVLCGGPSSEHEVSLSSVRSILEHIDNKKYTISVFYISKDLKCAQLSPDDYLTSRVPDATQLQPFMNVIQTVLPTFDVVLLAGLHGEFVEDGKLQAILDTYHISYTGSGMAASSLCMDKYRSSLLVSTQLPVLIPKTVCLSLHSSIDFKQLRFPLVIKPNTMGSSVGVKFVQNKNELQQQLDTIFSEYHQKEVVVQEQITDAIEVSCGYLVEKDGTGHLLPPVEIIPQSSPFFDYKAKYEVGGSIELSPPQHVPQKTSEKISTLAANIHSLLGCSTYSRSDFFVKGDEVYYLETNTLPGMTATSLLPKEAAAVKMSYAGLLDFIITNASVESK